VIDIVVASAIIGKFLISMLLLLPFKNRSGRGTSAIGKTSFGHWRFDSHLIRRNSGYFRGAVTKSASLSMRDLATMRLGNTDLARLAC